MQADERRVVGEKPGIVEAGRLVDRQRQHLEQFAGIRAGGVDTFEAHHLGIRARETDQTSAEDVGPPQPVEHFPAMAPKHPVEAGVPELRRIRLNQARPWKRERNALHRSAPPADGVRSLPLECGHGGWATTAKQDLRGAAANERRERLARPEGERQPGEIAGPHPSTHFAVTVQVARYEPEALAWQRIPTAERCHAIQQRWAAVAALLE